MANFLTPSQIQAAYFPILKSIKPSLNINDPNSDFVIRGNVFSGIVSGLYGDQAKVDNDSYVVSMDSASLDLRGQDLVLPRNQPTQADSPQVRIYGNNGTIIAVNQLTFLYVATNTLYTNTTSGTIGAGGSLDLAVICETYGEIGNITAPDVFTVVNPPGRVLTSADIIQSVADGSDLESDDNYRARLLSRIQSPPAGGNATDYYEWAFEASSAVQSAVVIRFALGLGTVAIYITAGTNNIDYAITNGISVVRVPSSTILADVQAYYNSIAPLTDCVIVYPPIEINIPVTVNVTLAAGITLTTIPNDPVNNPLNLNVQQLIQREVGRVLYHVPIGGRVIPGYTQGVVAASDIEFGLETWLSAVINPNTNTPIGIIPVLADVFVEQLNPPTDYNLQILGNEIVAPGTITVVTGGI